MPVPRTHPAAPSRARARAAIVLLVLTLLGGTAAAATAGGGAGRAPGSPPFTKPAPVSGFLVAPYLQAPGPDRMSVMFEPEPSAIGPTMAVEYREPGVEQWTRVAAEPERPPLSDDVRATPLDEPALAVYRADLTGLASRTVYDYRVVTAAGTTTPARFRTWPEPGDGVRQGRFIAISDIQGNHIAEQYFPRVLQAIVDNECFGDPARCVETIDGIVIPGDLVDRGSEIDDWRNEYFGPGDVLFRYLPQIPAMGNHDTPMEHYLYYFAPPANGSAGFEEEWYSTDFLNLRLLTLQSNFGGARLLERYAEQAAFVEQQLADAEAEGLDYVFASVHAPCKSELWVPGESPQVCDFVRSIEDWSRRTESISGHLFGHTHGYSRGQSRDVSHLWLNVASASGNIDDWGDYEMADYDEMEMSWDEFGYVRFEFATEGEPAVSVQRQTGGDDFSVYRDAFTPATVRDDITIGGDNQAPEQPVAALPAEPVVRTSDAVLHAPYRDADRDPLLEAHWQVRPATGTWTAPLHDVWGSETRSRNVWFDEDLNAGIDNDTWRVPHLEPGGYCWRVRHRDERWAWSPWSDDACFTVAGAAVSPNLLRDGDAEAGTGAWEVVEGQLQSTTGQDCNAADNAEISREPLSPLTAYDGLRLFSVGGCTGEVADRARVRQPVDVSGFAADIDAGRALGVLEAAVRTYSKWDVATVQFSALDGKGRVLDSSVPLVNQTGAWERKPTSTLLPRGTRTVEVVLTGLKQHGSTNDSFVDALAFRVSTSPEARRVEHQPVAGPGNGMGVIGGKGWEHPRPQVRQEAPGRGQGHGHGDGDGDGHGHGHGHGHPHR